MLVVSNQEIRLRNNALQKANAEATFEVLKNQVNPHFLFNSLNTINAMIGNTNDAAKAFVNDMSQVYRHVLSSANKPVVTLEEEMEFAMAYINMLHERHGANLKVEVISDTELMADLLPPMSLQILLENAVKHSVVSSRQPLLIKIEAKDKSVSVWNTIQEKKIKPPSTGTGLYNLNQRYWFLCKKEIDISKTDSKFKVSLPLLKIADVQLG
jgi:LytS/YehU family sensor histidine kinase